MFILLIKVSFSFFVYMFLYDSDDSGQFEMKTMGKPEGPKVLDILKNDQSSRLKKQQTQAEESNMFRTDDLTNPDNVNQVIKNVIKLFHADVLIL